MKKVSVIILLIFIEFSLVPSTLTSTESYDQIRNLVDMPVSGITPKNSLCEDLYLYPSGGILAEISYSPFDNFSFGLSFSIDNLIGDGEVTSQKYPNFNCRLRLFNETLFSPAIMIGFNNQGRGKYNTSSKRFQTLSPGFYIVAGKSYNWLFGSLGLHLGLNYSLDQEVRNRRPNIYLGFEQFILKNFSYNMEFNSNIDDRNKDFTLKAGLLNVSFKLFLQKDITAELIFRDILNHKKSPSGFERWLGIELIQNL